MEEQVEWSGISVGTFTLTPMEDGSFCLEDQRTGDLIEIPAHELELIFMTYCKEESFH